MISTITAEMTLGARFGFNSAALICNNVDEINMGHSFNIAAFCAIPVSESLIIQPEANIVFGEFARCKLNDTEWSMSGTFIEIPVLLKFGISAGSGAFGIFAGPQLSFAIGNLTEKTTSNGKSESTKISFKDANFKTVIFSGVIGLDYAFPVGPGVLVCDGRLMSDLRNIQDDDTPTRRFRLGVSIGYGLSL